MKPETYALTTCCTSMLSVTNIFMLEESHMIIMITIMTCMKVMPVTVGLTVLEV